jgi:hypothetical protein
MSDEAMHGSTELAVSELMLGSLIDEAHTLHPDDLVALVRRKGAMVGLRDVDVYLVDKEQRLLRPLGGDDDAGELTIDGSLAGRAYQRSDVVVGEAHGVSRRAWFPILDGTSRVGVMGAHVDASEGAALDGGRQLAGLLAFLIVAKSAHGDNIVRTSNAQPPSLSADMRWATLPPLAFEHGPVEVGAMLEPAYEIAGDALDYAIDRDTLHFAIFDAMGHGLRASQLATLAVFAYRNERRRGASLEEIYRAIDTVVASEFPPDCFVTAQLATLDLVSGIVHCINAGHPRPLLLRDHKVSEVPFDACVPIGLADDEAEVTDLSLQPDDTLVLLSDGMVEARSPDGKQFGVERLGAHLLRARAAQLTPSETLRRAAHAILEHHGGHLDDDATLLAVTWRGGHR